MTAEGERISRLEGRMDGLATAAQVSRLAEAINNLTDLNGQQHQEMAARFTAMEERAFSDNVTSLRSRITELEKDSAVSRGKLAVSVAIITALVTFIFTNWQTIAGWLHLRKPGGMERMFHLYAKVNEFFKMLIARFWLLWIVALCAFGPKLHSLLRRFV